MSAAATAGGLPNKLGKFELLMPLASGGMARIYIGRTTGIGSFERHVVLKLILPERANDEVAVQMFLDEARLAASLNHQNVAQVFEVGQDGGIHYLAMEYVHGQDLRALLSKAGSQGKRVPLDLALTVVSGAAAGLDHAHDRRGPDGVPLGIVHRDVSPSNIMIGYDGSVKLLDFGIAKATLRSVETQSGVIKGKFAYMAPEQCRGRAVDRRSDVFSLGIILYEITTQHRCFRADSDFDTMHRIVTGDVVRPSRLVQGYPLELEAIVMKALSVDAPSRYSSAGALLEAVEQFSIDARMSLSTMSLGRFMREMFGEQAEPWLNTTRSSQPSLAPRESTISSTNGSNGSDNMPAPRALPTPVLTPASSTLPTEQLLMRRESEAERAGERWRDEPIGPAPRTLLDLPRGGTDHDAAQDHADGEGEWNAKSYPTMQPAYPSTSPVALPLPSPRDSTPLPMYITPSAMPATAAPATQPALAPIASTRLGYAAAPGTTRTGSELGAPYPVYEPQIHGDLRPSRRWLVIGIGVGVLGAVVTLAVVFGSGGNAGDKDNGIVTVADTQVAAAPVAVDHASTPTPTPTPAPAPAPIAAKPVAPAPTPPQVVPPAPAPPAPAPPPAPVDDSVALHVTSDPDGADVLLAGKRLGTTPLDTTIPRATGATTLVVRRAHYGDQTVKVDFATDVTRALTLRKLDAPAVTVAAKPRAPKAPDCQPRNAVNPFDARPVCK